MNIDGYVVISGDELSTNAAKMLDHYQHRNELRVKLDLDNELAFKASQDSLAIDLDDYRAYGRAWTDYLMAVDRATIYEPIKLFGFIPVGRREKFSAVKCYQSLKNTNDNFWRHISIFNLEYLTENEVANFRDYYLGKHPAYTNKFNLEFLQGLIGLPKKEVVYLSITDYQTYKKWWTGYRSAGEIQPCDLLVESNGDIV